MNPLLLIIGVLVAALLGLLLWSTGKNAPARKQIQGKPASLDLTCKHAMNLSQIRQALERDDLDYIATKLDAQKVHNVKKERRQIALKYLADLREDFERLMDTAQIVVSLSPEVEAKEEWKRFRLAAEFRVKYQIARAKFSMGAFGFPRIEELSNIVSGLEIELEKVVSEISHAALATSESGSLKG